MYDIKTAIVGGGVVGLALAYHLSFADSDIAVFEQNPYLGDHASGRNSGVLHAGLYYETSSLKHTTCLRGNLLWREWGKNLGFDIFECGKYLVATDSSELKSLNILLDNARKNGVQALRSLSSDEVCELRQVVNCEQAFFSGSSAILDPSFAVKALGRAIYNRDIPIMLNDEVLSVTYNGKGFVIETTHGKVFSKNFVNAAGGFAVGIRKMLGLCDVENYWVKGSYIKTVQKMFNKVLVYPVPPSDLKGLGIHSSFESDGTVRFGPNTEECLEYSYTLNPSLLDEMMDPICSVFKGVDRNKLSADYCGIRSKIKVNGKLYKDFWIGTLAVHNIPGYVEFLGIESPGFTAAPALAEVGAKFLLS